MTKRIGSHLFFKISLRALSALPSYTKAKEHLGHAYLFIALYLLHCLAMDKRME